MARSADALQKRRDRARRAKLNHEIDVANVDSQFERRRRYNALQFSILQSSFGSQPQLGRQRSVMTADFVLAQQLGQLMSDPLGHAPRVDEDQRAAVRVDEFDHASIDLPPMLVRTNRSEFEFRHFNRKIQVPRMPDINNRRRPG